ncbi:hypothetical protein L1987_15000 [Smallanthus sonchifolius]|uniref:Uncharacterized protein n=1 Tax=Smallanthus sonchifolius TaxID=185202 RepID=A0ACB9J6D8_9ASTR|nr:hypothetical protein L1987_15000 [Smallanthus sonchifolius]
MKKRHLRSQFTGHFIELFENMLGFFLENLPRNQAQVKKEVIMMVVVMMVIMLTMKLRMLQFLSKRTPSSAPHEERQHSSPPIAQEAEEIKRLKQNNFKLSHSQSSKPKPFKRHVKCTSSSRTSYKNFRVSSRSSSSDDARKQGENREEAELKMHKLMKMCMMMLIMAIFSLAINRIIVKISLKLIYMAEFATSCLGSIMAKELEEKQNKEIERDEELKLRKRAQGDRRRLRKISIPKRKFNKSKEENVEDAVMLIKSKVSTLELEKDMLIYFLIAKNFQNRQLKHMKIDTLRSHVERFKRAKVETEVVKKIRDC